MLNFGSFQAFADSPKKYSARALEIVQRSLVIDMLAPLKIDLRPEAFANPLTAAEITAFRSSGINAFHHSIGTGGPGVQAETLEYLAGWHGLVGRDDHLFALVDKAADLDRAKAAGKIAVMIGLQNSEHQAPGMPRNTSAQPAVELTYNSRTSSARAAPTAWTAAS
jgi:membrane dipeptidase